jgi:hypothetical protein
MRLTCAFAAALLAPALAAGAEEWPRIALTLEGTLSRVPQTPSLAAGGAFSARLAFVEAAVWADWAMRAPPGDAGLGGTMLLGAGPCHDLGPLASLHALAVAGAYDVRLRDYVDGGWRSVREPAWGGRAGFRLHPQAVLGRIGQSRVWPVAGVWLTVLRVGRGSDRLRAAEWGGTVVVVTLALGAELAGPARHRMDSE